MAEIVGGIKIKFKGLLGMHGGGAVCSVSMSPCDLIRALDTVLTSHVSYQ